jgi:hypothetical protein
MAIPSNLPSWARVGAKVRRTGLWWDKFTDPSYGIVVSIDKDLLHIAVYTTRNETHGGQNLWWQYLGKSWNYEDFEEIIPVPAQTAWERLTRDDPF